MSTKKSIFLMIGLVALAGIIYMVIKFKSSDKEVADYVVPELQVANMQVTNLTANKAEMNMSMVMDNPAPVGINIDSLHYVIYIEDNEVARTTYPDSLQIEANDTTAFSLPLTVYYNKLQSVLNNLEEQGKDSANYRVNATIFTDMAIIPKDKLNLDIEKRLPLVRPPEIEVADIGVEDVGFSGATLKTEIIVTNKNAFSFGFRDMYYAVQLDNNESVEGSKPGTVNIPAKGSTSVTIPAEINFKEMGKNLIDLIRKGDDIQYSFNMNTELISDSEVLENSKIKLSSSGKLKSAVKAAKSVAEEN
ncbi:LEA type 2 family protein [Pontibacter silvestris]|uniref:LEA type 2 family protein n=1 Tax=Pontibacter silvestris TaxID=2305183 RepID=A0ABW4WYI5_9BACT|nr:LEA type 2 family protein [Pontibacter silvestris]MCC9137421.1 LEA type 2 family protein [Pontibacter silvestris]